MNNNTNSVSRRKFIESTAAAAFSAPYLLKSAVESRGKLNHACIGVGGMGRHDLQTFMQHPGVNIVAICDVDRNHLQKAKELLPKARTYTDWRELLEKENGNIDSINVTVPDHNHFSIAYKAIQNGKHVYCQKPLCHDVGEVQKLTEAAVKESVITQLGTQVAASKGDQLAVHLIKSGVIGKVKHAYLCSNRPGAIKTYRLPGPRPSEGSEVPSQLDWDLWIGTAPMRPYSPDIYHPAIWRTWQDFGTGWSGDIGCHIFDAVWKGLGLKAPIKVKAKVQKSWKESPARRADTWPQSDHITWVFPGNEMTKSNRLTLEWFDGHFYPPKKVTDLYKDKPYPAESAMLIGTEGALLIPHGGMPVLLPKENFDMNKWPEFSDENHYHNFVDACLGGKTTKSDFVQTGPMTKAILLGTVAIRNPGKTLRWDAENLRFSNNSHANSYLLRKYRQGWQLAGF